MSWIFFLVWQSSGNLKIIMTYCSSQTIKFSIFDLNIVHLFNSFQLFIWVIKILHIPWSTCYEGRKVILFHAVDMVLLWWLLGLITDKSWLWKLNFSINCSNMRKILFGIFSNIYIDNKSLTNMSWYRYLWYIL